jgi:hypothetical protein
VDGVPADGSQGDIITSRLMSVNGDEQRAAQVEEKAPDTTDRLW